MQSIDRDEMVEELGEVRATLLARRSDLSAQMSKLAYEEFDESDIVPAAVETYPTRRAMRRRSGGGRCCTRSPSS
jgi:hypothetical protein